EGCQTVLCGDVADDLHIHVDAAVRAGVAGRADQHGNADAARGEQHFLEVMLLPGARACTAVIAERHGADVVAAGVGGDEIGAGFHREAEAFGLEGREAQVAVRADDPDGWHVFLSRGAWLPFSYAQTVPEWRRGQVRPVRARACPMRGIRAHEWEPRG